MIQFLVEVEAWGRVWYLFLKQLFKAERVETVEKDRSKQKKLLDVIEQRVFVGDQTNHSPFAASIVRRANLSECLDRLLDRKSVV